MLSGKRLRQYLARTVLGYKPAPASKPICQAKRATPRRGPERDTKYLSWVRTLACCACHREGRSESAHTGSDGGMSMKASDKSVIPLCPSCHRTGPFAYHRIGKAAFERVWGVNCARVVVLLNAEWEPGA